MGADYVSIRVSTLRGDQPIDFNAYVKINDKHVLYLRKGDSFEGKRLDRLKEKKLKKMFIIQEDEVHYRDYLHRNIEMAYDKNSGKSLEVRAEIVQGAQESHAEAVMENPEDAAAYQDAKIAALQFANFIQNEDEALNFMLGFDNVDVSLAHHGVSVSSLSLALAKTAGITDPRQTQLLTLGAILHDIGHVNTTIKLNQPLSHLTKEEMEIYRQHPLTGGVRVQDKKHFDQSVINIIVQHEERIDGSGFPYGLQENKIDPLSIIVGAANALDRLISLEEVPKKEARKRLMIEGMGLFPLPYLKSLGDLMG